MGKQLFCESIEWNGYNIIVSGNIHHGMKSPDNLTPDDNPEVEIIEVTYNDQIQIMHEDERINKELQEKIIEKLI